MILLTRQSGVGFMLNPDLIERVDAVPDTVITLVDGKKYVVAESMFEVLTRIVAYRGAVLASGAALGRPPRPTPSPGMAGLRVFQSSPA